jgi:predicted signal transduction protein with EAL and GGDEF domain
MARIGGWMLSKLKFVSNGIHFRVLMLVIGLAVTLVAAQFVTDTVLETQKVRDQRLVEARSITTVVARSLENQFDYFELSDIEEILRSVRITEHVKQVSAVDRELTFFLDGDPATPTLLPIGNNAEQIKAIETGKPDFSISDDAITVAEPLLRNGSAIGAVMIRFENPTFSEVMWPILQSNFFSLVPILSLGIILAGILVKQITSPLLRLSETAEQVADGDLKRTMPIEGPNEIRQLGLAFSGMIGKLKENIEQIYELAYVDRTTQLPNREFFRKELTRAIRRAVRQKVTGGLLFVDLEGFKRVNDTHGHDAGDAILSQFSERLANVLRAEDLIAFKAMNAMETEEGDSDNANKNKQMLARLGGDEFTVLLSEIREPTDAATVSQRIIEAVSEPFDINGAKVNIGASVGIAIFPRDGSDYQTILKSADMAMYQAKEEGKNTYRYFSSELNAEASRRMEIEQDLRIALEENNQLELYYQPKIHCSSALPKSAEALIRWKHPEKGMIPPLDFINIAEDCGLILPLGKWVLEQACKQLKAFEDEGIDISIAVNISTAQFERPDLSDIVIEVLNQTGANPANLELELTESMAMQNPDVALKHINILKKLGVRFAIDDFGTGYSNLSQLSRLPFDVFKIDRSFVDKLTNREDEHGRIIVRTILGMANSLNYETVAEGVETVSQLEFLSEYGCTYAQGYYFARPMPSKEFYQWYTAWNKQDDSVVAALMRQGSAA